MTRRAPAWAALAAALGAAAAPGAMSACDPLLDGGDLGPPSMVLEGRLLGLDPSDSNLPASAALIWTKPSEVPERFQRHALTLRSDDVGAFQLQVFGQPDAQSVETLDAGADAPSVALAFLAVLDGDALPPYLAPHELRQSVRGASGDHYMLWVHRPEAARESLVNLVLNPDALAEGMNLVVGLCRPGRASELLVVPLERVAVVGLEQIGLGTCLDVFWGDWR